MSNVTTLPAARKDIVTSVAFNELRLPYVEAFADGFGIDNIRWKVLIDTVYPAAKSVDAIAMALSYCKQRNLDPFKRPVHIVPMWSSEKKVYIETVWPGISELRTTATRTGEYAGCDAAEFGPTIRREFKGVVEVWENKQRVDREITVTVEFPEWCQITVRRIIRNQVVTFVGPKAYWLESYAKRGKADVPNDMWCKRPFGQIEKCAEAGALRRAFPEEIGNEYTAEEMEGQAIFAGESITATAPIKPKLPPAPPPPASGTKPPSTPPQAAPAAFDFDGLRAALREAQTEDAANDVFDRLVTQKSRHMTDDELIECDNIMREACAAFVPVEE